MISLCIPTMDRFDTFLSRYLNEYIKYLNNNIISEIIICDENGNDYEKIISTYPNISNLHVYKNESILGVFKNKLKVCSFANHEYIALIDSDNFCDESYFIKVKEYIQNNKLTKHSIIAPTFAKPNFNFTQFNNAIVTKYNLKQYYHLNNFEILLNTGNYILTKGIIHDIKHDETIMLQNSACDVLFFNLLAFQQFNDFEIHIVKDLEYDHVVHGGSTYLNTIHYCSHFINSVVMPGYQSLL